MAEGVVSVDKKRTLINVLFSSIAIFFACRICYNSARGMLYQIVTRVVDELKVIVFNNPPLYLKILEIKSMGE